MQNPLSPPTNPHPEGAWPKAVETWTSVRVPLLLPRIHTLRLAPTNPTATRALVILSPSPTPYHAPTRLRFHAAFPVRAALGAQPVTVCDEQGAVIPSRLTESSLTSHPDIPADRCLWSLTLEFVASNIPARGWRTYAAAFGASPESRSDDTAFWSTLPEADLPVFETDCHPGDLPLIGTFDATDIDFGA